MLGSQGSQIYAWYLQTNVACFLPENSRTYHDLCMTNQRRTHHCLYCPIRKWVWMSFSVSPNTVRSSTGIFKIQQGQQRLQTAPSVDDRQKQGWCICHLKRLNRDNLLKSLCSLAPSSAFGETVEVHCANTWKDTHCQSSSADSSLSRFEVQQLDLRCCGEDRSLHRCGHNSVWFDAAWPADVLYWEY